MAQFGAPNFLGVIDAYEAGSRRAERNRLAELDNLGRELQGKALGGDQNALARLGQVNPQAYMQTKSFTREEKAARLDELAAGAMAADTPEKWQAFVQRSAAQGHKLDPGETRESILDQAMGWKEKLAQSNADRQFNAAQKNSDRQYQLDLRQFGLAQANANWQRKVDQAKLDAQTPDLVELYDPQTGQPFKAKYNPQTGGFDRVGGVKKDQGSGGEFGLNPVWAQDSNGNWQLFQPNKGGGAPARVNFPEGVNPQPQVNFLDTGTGYVPRATKGGQPVGQAIPKDIAGAEAEKAKGKGVGEAAVDYASISSKMPGLEKVVADLDNLAEGATYTMGGQALDFGRRQLGMDPRASAVARAEYISKVDNQILPLLRDTFGAQFTQREGESLKATLGDPNLSPQEKQAVLRSFIEQKRRDVEALGQRSGQGDQPPRRLKFNPSTGDLE